jgi:hypothetical protein
LAPSRDCLDAADEVTVLEATAGAGVGVAEGLMTGLAEVARPITGGVKTRGVPGFEDFGVFGFDHDVKKSSSGSSFTTAEGGSIPSTTIPAVKLC